MPTPCGEAWGSCSSVKRKEAGPGVSAASHEGGGSQQRQVATGEGSCWQSGWPGRTVVSDQASRGWQLGAIRLAGEW